MVRRSKRNKNGKEKETTAVEEKQDIVKKKHAKIEKTLSLPVPKTDVTGGNKRKNKELKKQARASEMTPNISGEAKSSQSGNLGNANRTIAADLQEILRKATASSTLSTFKIPKKEHHATGNPTITNTSKTTTNDATSSVTGDRKRKSEDADANKSNKKRYNDLSSRGNVTQKAAKNELQQQQASAKIAPKCKSKLTATRSTTLDSPRPECSTKPTQDVQIDTPQMALMRQRLPKCRSKLTTTRSTTLDSPGPECSTKPTQDEPIDTPQMMFLRQKLANKSHKVSTTVKQQSNKKQQIIPATSRIPETSTCTQPVINWSLNDIIPSATAVVNDNVTAPIQDVYQTGENDNKTDPQHEDFIFDDMDVDVDSLPSTQLKQLLVIFDTNVWISHRNLIQRVLDMEIKFPTGPTSVILVIPWMVLQEIDRGKGNNANEFRNASKYIHSLLVAKHPRVKGQKATEAIIGMEFNELNADDSILNCAVQCSKLLQFETILVTNDVNLLNKALIHDLNAFKADSNLLSNLQKLSSTEQSNVVINEPAIQPLDVISNSFVTQSSFCLSPYTPAAPNTLISESHSESLADVVMNMDVDDPMCGDDIASTDNEHNFENQQQDMPKEPPTFEAVAKSLQQALTTIIVPKMIEDYGIEGWKDALKIKPPYSIENGLKCIQAHWIAVFQFMFSQRAYDVLDELLKIFQKKPTGEEESKQWRFNVCQVAKVFISLSSGVANKPCVSECNRLLQEYIQIESMHVTQ